MELHSTNTQFDKMICVRRFWLDVSEKIVTVSGVISLSQVQNKSSSRGRAYEYDNIELSMTEGDN